ncbi:hypothetical protein AND_002332 [Anopheles darlingi]|uniref:Cytochrome c oxidase assembly factor 6 n=1 Tax=Anopheles darlingi TaxID=43151 RepID=W5JP55_ANODA|nr:hypothetical protein AND_002332 [Anopheles darlingi]
MSDFPDKDARAKCWKARDDYWACLDKHAPEYQCTSQAPEPPACIQLRRLYQQSCPAQWVKHFDRKRTYDQFKQKMAKGYEPLNDVKP